MPIPTQRLRRVVATLHPLHSHTAFTATLLLMGSTVASRAIGLAKTKYTAYLLGRGAAADAFNAAFQLPDMLAYFLVGGAASITFVSMLARYRDQGREAEGERAMSIILTAMTVVLGSAIVLAEFIAPLYVRLLLHGFENDPPKAALCVQLTRILLPAQIFFLAGGVFGAVLLVRKQFTVQAIAPLVYNCGIILGGIVLYRQLGPRSLAIGAVAGAFLGPFLLNAIWAHRVGMRYRPMFNWSDRGLHEWIHMSLPLILGISLVTADNWIINYFASHSAGDLSLLTYAKQFFTAPVALGQAAGAASLPFFASLYAKPDRTMFTLAVSASVSRILALSVLLTSFMVTMALPAIDVVLRGGAFHRPDSIAMAHYFAIFSISLCLWSAQAIYSRAFYATGNTLTPMIAGTAVTLISVPIYRSLYDSVGPSGLAIASDIGILMQTVTLAILLHRRRTVSLRGLDCPELLRCVVASCVSYVALVTLRHYASSTKRSYELVLLIGAGLLWTGVSILALHLTGSTLASQLAARFTNPEIGRREK